MTSDPLFRMTINDVFSIRGRGTVVTGQIETGTLKLGDEIQIQQRDFPKNMVVAGIEASGRQIPQAQAGDNVGILLAEVNKSDLQRGDILTG